MDIIKEDLRSKEAQPLIEEIVTMIKEYQELTGEMEFTPNASSTRWAIKHLGKTVTSSQLFSGEIFTDEILHMIDEKVIKPHFLLPDLFDENELAILANPESDEDGENEELEANGEE